MKKITLVFIIVFLLICSFIYGTKFNSYSNKSDVASENNLKESTLAVTTPEVSVSAIPTAVPTVSSTPVSTPKPTPKPTSVPSPFTMTNIAKHNSKSDCYLVINNNVYSVSSYIDSHPGGTRKIVEKCGQEVTGIFAQVHSNKAWDLLAKYKIGTVSK